MLVDVNEKYHKLSVYLKETLKSTHILDSLFRNRVQQAYKGSFLGSIWFLLDPLLQLLIWVFIFQFVFSVGRADYPIYLFCAITCWQFISGAWIGGTNSISGMGNFLLEVNLPKVILPLNAVLTSIYQFAHAFVILFIMLIIYGKIPNANILYFPLVFFVMVIMAVGGSMLFAPVQVFLPDFGKIFSHIIRIWWFLSPGIYPMSRIPEKYHDIYQLNPMVGLFESFRNTLLYGKPPAWEPFMITCIFAIVLFAVGFFVFYKTEPYLTKLI